MLDNSAQNQDKLKVMHNVEQKETVSTVVDRIGGLFKQQCVTSVEW